MTVGDLIQHLQHAADVFGANTEVKIIAASGSTEREVAADRMDVQNIIVISGNDILTAITLTATFEKLG